MTVACLQGYSLESTQPYTPANGEAFLAVSFGENVKPSVSGFWLILALARLGPGHR